MTVKELIESLKKFPDDTRVVVDLIEGFHDIVELAQGGLGEKNGGVPVVWITLNKMK